VTLEVESQEEGYLAKVLVDDSKGVVPVGTPIGIISEHEEGLADAAATPCPVANLYSDEARRLQLHVAQWQAYVSKRPGAPSSPGCS
jgi:pyruvate/2-oxoglutarate dehydrogenase complex dihydrolipoamide acyltransferase (E2) component